jgi:hypothetical protein
VLRAPLTLDEARCIANKQHPKLVRAELLSSRLREGSPEESKRRYQPANPGRVFAVANHLSSPRKGETVRSTCYEVPRICFLGSLGLLVFGQNTEGEIR